MGHSRFPQLMNQLLMRETIQVLPCTIEIGNGLVQREFGVSFGGKLEKLF